MTGLGGTEGTGRSESTPASGLGRAARRTVIASFLGSTFEWFDFGLYGTISALAFGKVFFANADPSIGTLVALTSTAVGFITRPIGGIVFGHFGDRIGRKKLLVLTMLIMGIPTLLIGLLPGYAQIGAAAPILLLLFRLLQGFGLGGEYAGAALATIESVPVERRGRFGSIPQIGNPVGGLLGGALVLIITTLFPGPAFVAFAWRIPFLVSVVLLVYALIVRLHLHETGDFEKLEETGGRAKVPIAEVLRHHLGTLLLAMGARCIDAVGGNIGGVVVLTYAVQYLHLADNVIPAGNIIENIIAVPYMLFAGRLGDRFGRRRVYIIGLILMGVMTFPEWALLSTAVVPLMYIGIMLFGLANRTQFSVQSAYLSDVFPTEVRYTAISLVYQVTAIVGGLTPPVAFAVLIASHGAPWLVALGILIVAAISSACALALRSHVRRGSAVPVPAAAA